VYEHLLGDTCAVGDILHKAIFVLNEVWRALGNVIDAALTVYATSASKYKAYGCDARFRANDHVTMMQCMFRREVKRWYKSAVFQHFYNICIVVFRIIWLA
jgi:hypothetical protein